MNLTSIKYGLLALNSALVDHFHNYLNLINVKIKLLSFILSRTHSWQSTSVDGKHPICIMWLLESIGIQIP